MQYYFIPFLSQLILIYHQLNSLNAKAIIGKNVARVENKIFSPVISILIYKESTSQPEQDVICTATLITLDHAVTAEHCISLHIDEQLVLIMGSRNIRKGKPRYMMWWIAHDQWSVRFSQPSPYISNDIAVIKILDSAMKHITPASLSQALVPELNGWTVTIAGWGVGNNGKHSKHLKKATVKVISNDQCNKIATSIQQDEIVIPQQWFCTMTRPYVLLDDGDSGGPVFDKKQNLIGINTGNCPRLYNQFHPNKTNLHLAVGYYSNFLKFTMGT